MMSGTRRDFIKKTCGLCASVAGIALLAPTLQGCSSLMRVQPALIEGKLSLPVSSFVEEAKVVIIQNKDLEYDIAVVKYLDNTYRSFEMRCTHQETSLVPTNSGFHCNMHGSSFSLTGKVNNKPATENLKEFKTFLDSGIIQVSI